jgi:hypothetical protein
MSITMYAIELQCIADDLDAIGRPVDDRELACSLLMG